MNKLKSMNHIINELELSLLIINSSNYKYRLKKYYSKMEVRKRDNYFSAQTMNSRLKNKHNNTHHPHELTSTTNQEFSTGSATFKGLEPVCKLGLQSSPLDISNSIRTNTKTNKYIEEKKQMPYVHTKLKMSDYIDANIDKFQAFTTLTFNFDVISYDDAKYFFYNWMRVQKRKKLINYYIGTWELTKKGRVHFHLLTDYMPPFPRDSIGWRHGFVYTRPITRPEGLARYMTKYLTKGLEVERKGTRKLIKSNSLKKARNSNCFSISF